jgi:tetratricopeptide (TPR) repeat protein
MKKQPASPQTLMLAARYLNDAGDYRAAVSAIRYAQGLDPGEAAYILAEAAIQCDNFPQRRFSGELGDKLKHITITNRGTVNTLDQFRKMVQVCRPSTVNYGALLDIYQVLKTSRNEKIAYLATFGYGYIQLQLGNYSAAIDAWEQVIREDKYAAVLKPQVEEIRKLQARQSTEPQPGTESAPLKDGELKSR